MIPVDIEDIADEIAPQLYGMTLLMVRVQALEQRDPTKLFALFRDAAIIRYLRIGRGPEVKLWQEQIENFEKLQELAIQDAG